METLKLFTAVFFIAGCYLFVGFDDYQKKFDKPMIVRYNCDILMGGWHPDVPKDVIDKCNDPNREGKYVKTYQE
jgi:hypothetical protein